MESKKYETVKFQMGYHKNGPQMIVKCKEIFIAQDEGIEEKDLNRRIFSLQQGSEKYWRRRIVERQIC
ncbi:hypothetical protein ACM44_09265 [Chryseobacterium koreense CCUG 49689]|uniref:Uncharacterized protein n=1 Tax=Chryseobacterium koreense CCUG 49689 TaxID=1304281 RepID=A0A0J7IXT9_9FLAO|nr:hypothetical protein ACM44_09265 [Chryseobacterium koreense CCUG 49689]